jgi:hypothetical protein
MPAPGWQLWADTVLQAEALIWREGAGVPPRPTAGLVIDDADAERLLESLPGLAGADRERIEEVRRRTADARARAEAALAAELAGGSAYAGVVRAAGLSGSAARVLALAAAVETDPGRQQLVAYLNDDVRCPRPTLALLARLGLLAEVAPEAALIRSGLIEVHPAGTWALTQIALPERVCWHLSGVDDRDPQLPPGAEILPAAAPVNGGAGADGAGPDRACVLLAVGADRQSRREAIAVRWNGAPLLVTPPPGTADAGRALVREALLRRAGVVLEVSGPLTPETVRLIEDSPVAWAVSSAAELALAELPRRPWAELRVHDGIAPPEDWTRALGVAYEPDHPLDREQLRLLSLAVGRGRPGAEVNGNGELSTAVARGVRRLASGQLDRHAVRTVPSCTWADLILPRDHLAQLRELTARYRHRRTVYDQWGFRAVPSTGIVALFAGPSGTGKTMAAEIIAGDLGLDLYRVDLSAIVSKYIGETEKNLSEIFDAARAAAAVLLFDEADALFGKRTEVSDAHDRYANIEVSYLLQRLESHDGCVILTTNLRRNIDQAFVRRLSATVEFAAPDAAQRRAIWQGNLPAGAPLGDLDLDFLAERFAVTGGMIRNVTLGAAFLAAESGQPIGMRHLVLAMKRELQKAGRLQTEDDFGPWYALVAGQEEVGHAQPAR